MKMHSVKVGLLFLISTTIHAVPEPNGLALAARDNYIKMRQSLDAPLPVWFKSNADSVDKVKSMRRPPNVTMDQLTNSNLHVQWFTNFTPDENEADSAAKAAFRKFVLDRLPSGQLFGDKDNERSKTWQRAGNYEPPTSGDNANAKDSPASLFGY